VFIVSDDAMLILSVAQQHAAVIQRVLAISPKRYQRNLVTYLTTAETEALLAACDQGTPAAATSSSATR
jgi:hypothetical protein